MKSQIVKCFSFALLLFGLSSCGGPSQAANPNCKAGGKCDTPSNDPKNQDRLNAETTCLSRKSDILRTDQPGYAVVTLSSGATQPAIRWACADVAGVNEVNQDDRGQEYCEYFVIARPAGVATAAVVGRGNPITIDPQTHKPIPPVKSGLALDPTSVAGKAVLTLARDPAHQADVVGQCIFTSWHSDVSNPVTSTTDVLGVTVNSHNFRMEGGINSNFAAVNLLGSCLETNGQDTQGKVPHVANLQSPLTHNSPVTEMDYQSDMYRGCMFDWTQFQTEWRRSDPTICTEAMRLTDCGCHLKANPGANVFTTVSAILPPRADTTDAFNQPPSAESIAALRGFPLGTWSTADRLKDGSGCQFVDPGDGSRTIVSCPISASDLATHIMDPKEYCRTQYGKDVVVHIPLPVDGLACSPDLSSSVAMTCNATPWIVTQ